MIILTAYINNNSPNVGKQGKLALHMNEMLMRPWEWLHLK